MGFESIINNSPPFCRLEHFFKNDDLRKLSNHKKLKLGRHRTEQTAERSVKMGINGRGHFSELMPEEIVRACCASSYRDGAQEVSTLTGQAVSHTSAWTVVQRVGESVGQQERKAAQLAAKGEGAGKLERKLLFEEQDGIWRRLQGASREMKLAIAYDGAKRTGKKR